MSLILVFLLLALGFALLIKGADFLVDGASSLALRFRISPIVIGLTIVSFGTSAPELVVNVMAAINGKTGLSFGNVIGSNIVNILLILGVAAMIKPINAKRGTVWKEIPFSLLAVAALFLLCNDGLFDPADNVLSRNDGIVLILFFVLFLVYTFGIPKIEIEALSDIAQMPLGKIILLIVVGIAGLFGGGKIVVNNAVYIAELFGLSDRIIGLTIVAIGTSLPELVTSAVAAAKHQADIAIGNVVGSNIFNIFFVLGITAIIQPLPFQNSINLDLAVLAVASCALFLSVFAGPNNRINRIEAAGFLLLYIAYTVMLLLQL